MPDSYDGGYDAGAETTVELAGRVLTVFNRYRDSSVALTRETLCGILGCEDRSLRRAIRHLRCVGHLIVADEAGGYRFAKKGDEVYGYTSTLKSRIQALRTVTESMEAAARKEFGPKQEALPL